MSSNDWRQGSSVSEIKMGIANMLVEGNLNLNWVLSPISPHHKCAAQPLLTETLCECVTQMQHIDPAGYSNQQDWMNWLGKVSSFMINSLIYSTSHMAIFLNKNNISFYHLKIRWGIWGVFGYIRECLGNESPNQVSLELKRTPPAYPVFILIWRLKAQNTLIYFS